MAAGEVVATTLVTLSVERAFTAFTEDIDRWWRRSGDAGAIVRFADERLVAVSPAGVEILAIVLEWEPPHRLELQWHGPHAHAGDTVAPDFAPEAAGTRVTITHRRLGLRPEDEVAAVLGFWWGDVLTRLGAAKPTGAG